ncbi:MAG: formate C-acetyltransferase/glycerol dehydratase family glycyl radical enzyme [Promethearchaeati archaeon SRVP18_Atabeyarchaeia-1]
MARVSKNVSRIEGFPYPKDAKLAGKFLTDFFELLGKNKEILRSWVELRALFQIHVESPEVLVSIDTLSGKGMRVSLGEAKGTPNVIMTLNANTFHELYSGKLSTFQAFGSEAVRTDGDRSLVTRMTKTLPQSIKAYTDYCKGLGIHVESLESEATSKAALEERAKAVTQGSRTERLKKLFLRRQREICVERARYYTESYRSTEGEPAVIRQAKALRNVLDNLPVHIYEDEMIVGNISSKPLGAGVYPETVLGPRIEGELNRISQRSTNPFTIGAGEKRELQESIFPYWRGKTIIDLARKYWSKEVADLFDRLGVFIFTEIGGIGHMLINHERVLRIGLNGIIAEANRRRKGLLKEDMSGDPGKQQQLEFLEAVEIACKSVIDFARRYGGLAEELAGTEKDPARRGELEEIARICLKVPENPADTIHECLQAMFFTHIACQVESWESAISVGRLDQFLKPYYEADRQAGRTDEVKAQELFECFFLKLSSVIPLFDADASIAFAGLTAFANVVIGGVDKDGNDATNDLSYVILNAVKRMKTPQPNFGIRVHETSPERLLTEVCRAALEMGTLPHVFNDRLVIKSMVNRGIPIEEARNYGIIGCVEPAVPGRSFTSSDAALFNLGLCLELALNDGKARLMSGQIGPQTGSPASFTSMEGVLNAFAQQVQYLIRKMVEGLDVLARIHAEVKPTPLASSLTDNCLASGKDLTRGGAVYNFTGPQGVGLATVADSLAAIDQLVFRDKKATMDEISKALSKNFAGYEPLRQMLINSAPKYGTDNDLADTYARQVGEIFCKEIEKYQNPRNGRYQPGLYSVTMHLTFGMLTGALPNGRKASKPLSCGVTPEPGTASFGPTALLRSAAKLNYELVSNGAVLGLKFSPSTFRGDEGLRNLGSLVESFFRLGGMHIQANFVGRETLLAAQKCPDEYRDLVVRVAGYSALFTDLDRLVQDEIIARTEF